MLGGFVEREPMFAFARDPFAAALPIGWLVIRGADVIHDPPLLALVSGLGIFGAAFLLSWSAEVAEPTCRALSRWLRWR